MKSTCHCKSHHIISHHITKRDVYIERKREREKEEEKKWHYGRLSVLKVSPGHLQEGKNMEEKKFG